MEKTKSKTERFHIRRPEAEEAKAIWEVEKASFPASEAASYEAIVHRINAFSDTFLVLAEENKIIGLLNGCRSSQPRIKDEMFLPSCKNDPNGDYVLLFGLAVAPEYRGLQCGALLMNQMVRQCREAGVKQLILTCKENYVPYYENIGYENHGKSDSVHGGAVWYDMVYPLV